MRKLTNLTCVVLRHASLATESPDSNDSDKFFLQELPVGTPPKLNGTPWRRADSLASPRSSRLFGGAQGGSGHGRTRSLTLTDPTLRGSRSSVHQMFQERLKKPVAVHMRETLDVFYAFFDLESGEVIYVSPEETGCTNVNFPPVDPLHFLSPESLHSPRCRLRMYARSQAAHAEDYQVIIDTIIDWQRLTLVSNQISNVEKSFPRNTILFEFTDGFFGLPGDHGVLMEEDPSRASLSMDTNRMKASYRYETLLRIVAAQKEIFLLSQDTKRLVHIGERKLQRTDRIKAVEIQKQDLLYKINHIENGITEQTQELQSMKYRLFQIKSSLRSKLERIEVSRKHGIRSVNELLQKRQELVNAERLSLEQSLLLISQQKFMALELRSIFCIEELTVRPKSAGQSHGRTSTFFTINGFFLPNSEFQSKGDDRVASALGMVAHLLSFIAELFDVPLRYPVLLKSSRSSIFDYITDTSVSNQYPLFSKSVERYRFEYGVFLLNKNIQQLLNYFGHKVKQLRNTLENLLILWRILEEHRHESSHNTGSVRRLSSILSLHPDSSISHALAGAFDESLRSVQSPTSSRSKTEPLINRRNSSTLRTESRSVSPTKLSGVFGESTKGGGVLMDNEDALWLGGGSRARDSSFLSEDVVFKMERWNLGGAE